MLFVTIESKHFLHTKVKQSTGVGLLDHYHYVLDVTVNMNLGSLAAHHMLHDMVHNKKVCY